MKTLAQQTFVKEVSAAHPFGAIINETDTNDGTPVVREVYNDHLVNHYKLLQKTGIVANGLEDNETNGYQIIEALEKLPNKLNDIEQILTKSGSVWSINLPIELLPNKYFFFAKATDDFVNGTSYTFEGTGLTSYPFTSMGFNASDEVLIILDTSGVRAFSLSFLNNLSDNIFTVMGSPIAFNDSNKMYYQKDGSLVSDVPSINNLENIIRVDLSDGTILVNDILISNGFVICFCFKPSTNLYFFRQFSLYDLSVSFAVSLVGTSFASTTNYFPYVYAKQGFIYVTNAMNSSNIDYSISKLAYNPSTAQLSLVSSIDLDSSFEKTSNTVIKNDLLYTLVLGILSSYNLSTGAKIVLGNYGVVNGNLFGYNGKIYFGSGEVAKAWNL